MFERIVKISGAYDKRSLIPGENYGIGACIIWFILKGPKGAVQFQIGTDWYLPEVQEELSVKHPHKDKYIFPKPSGWDVGYHSPVPMYEGQSSIGKCDILDCECYYDGSGTRAHEWIPSFIAGGTEWLWPRLEKEYKERFES